MWVYIPIYKLLGFWFFFFYLFDYWNHEILHFCPKYAKRCKSQKRTGTCGPLKNILRYRITLSEDYYWFARGAVSLSELGWLTGKGGLGGPRATRGNHSAGWTWKMARDWGKDNRAKGNWWLFQQWKREGGWWREKVSDEMDDCALSPVCGQIHPAKQMWCYNWVWG